MYIISNKLKISTFTHPGLVRDKDKLKKPMG